MAIQTDEYGQPVLDDQGNPVQIAEPAPPPAPPPQPGGRWTPPSGVMAGGPPVAPQTLPPGATPMLVNRGGQAAPGAPVQPPAGQGRMYMGPALSPSDESAFMLSPAGTRVNAVPPPTPEQATGAAGRVAAGTGAESNKAALGRLRSVDAPGSRTLGVMNAPAPDPMDEVMQLAQRMNVPLRDATAAVKASEQFQLSRARTAMIKTLTDQGVPEPEAVRLANNKYGLPMASGYKGTGMTDYQQVETKMRQQQLDQAAARTNRIVPAKPDPVLGRERLETEKALNKLNAGIVDGSVPGRLRSDGKPNPKWPAVEAELKRLNDRLQQLQAPTAPTTATGTTPGPVAPLSTGPQKVTNKEQFEALPSGSIYIGKDGKRYRKP